MRAKGYPTIAVGTLLLALARLEDEEGFFAAAREAGAAVEDLPWFLLGRTILLYKLGQRRSARRALRDFANHQAVWEADGIIADTPDFTTWAEGVEGVREQAEEFAARYGF